MKNFYLSLLVFCCTLAASAQFSGDYAPANWTTSISAGSSGSVNTDAAPASITITGSNDPGNQRTETPVNTDYTIVATTSGTWSFNWSYHSNDMENDPQYDLAGILINGEFTQFSSNTGGVDQSGTFTAPAVTAGTVIGFRVSAVDNSYGNATLTISNFASPGNVLPVRLISFAAKSQAQNVLLQWRTAEESNLSGFTVERSADGRNFSTVTTLTARNAPDPQTYEATDDAPLAGTSYYRLRIKEKAGEERLSAVAAVKRSFRTDLQVYPNPVKDRLSITVNPGKAGSEELQIIDAGGRMVLSKIYNLQAGRQTININRLPLTKGLYYIRLGNKVVSFMKE